MTLFCDFQCPYCRQMSATIQKVLEKYPNDIRFVYKHFPLSFHAAARVAAEAFQSAAANGKGWELHDAMFKDQTSLSRESVLAAAKGLGLDPAALAADLDSKRFAKLVDRQIAEGEAVGVEGTPTLFINGRAAEGKALDELVPIIDEEFEEARQLRAKGVTDVYGQRTAKGKVQQAFEDQINTFDLARASSMGTGDGSVALVLFSDFQCPYCGKFREPMEGLLKRYPGQAKLYFKHFPLNMHENAHKAAQAGVAAQLAGRFWELHNLMFDNSKNLGEQSLVELGRRAGLPAEQLADELKRGIHKILVDKDLEEGRKAGVRGTPTLFVNGRKYTGTARTADTMARDIDKFILGR